MIHIIKEETSRVHRRFFSAVMAANLRTHSAGTHDDHRAAFTQQSTILFWRTDQNTFTVKVFPEIALNRQVYNIVIYTHGGIFKGFVSIH